MLPSAVLICSPFNDSFNVSVLWPFYSAKDLQSAGIVAYPVVMGQRRRMMQLDVG